MGQYQSFHIQKFMRLPEEVGKKLDSSIPLRLVNRGAQASGRLSAKPPRKDQTMEYWNTLKTYLATLDSVLEELKPIAQKVARQNTVIVMTCNHGQVRTVRVRGTVGQTSIPQLTSIILMLPTSKQLNQPAERIANEFRVLSEGAKSRPVGSVGLCHR